VSHQVLVIYDGDCRFCRWGIEWVQRLDVQNALAFCPFGQPEAEAALADLPADRRYESMHALVNGRLYSDTEAARLVLQRLPLGGVSAALGVHHLYPLLARHRLTLGRLVPDRPAASTCGERS
jgi:predicted DCC family thiol-disulfide oxidoreductase YuxK